MGAVDLSPVFRHLFTIVHMHKMVFLELDKYSSFSRPTVGYCVYVPELIHKNDKTHRKEH